MSVSSELLVAGFNDAVHDGQQVFRALLTAMSEPGKLQQPNLIAEGPGALNAISWQVALALLDADTPVWLSERLAADAAIASNLRFHCQSPQVDSPQSAAFALCDASDVPDITLLNMGSAEQPDRSTTLIVQVPAISSEPHWTLTGPGIETERQLRIGGLSSTCVEQLIASRQRFPMGIDCIFCSTDTLVAVPRSTQIDINMGGR
ncbi:phosphonate C-P lyase system protein PhnH [Neptunomonas sp. XY-337]|uniref:phosphonate C-P lyase system protein PhnH n=1 Tax=Neptunomonas sp. XY-337 TaxID=2561897 RepID=UPI0010AAF22E|nr:phosphonate C-P lyase system protein PhnH [Neptunomonas sp. XY-337]